MDRQKTQHPPAIKRNINLTGDERSPADMAASLKILEAQISEHKTTENALEQSIAFQKALIESIPLPVYCKDTQGCFTSANKAFLDFFGISEQELLGKTAFDFSPKYLAEMYAAKDQELLQNPGQQVYESRMFDHNQVEHTVIITKSTFTCSNGEVAGIIGVFQDISALKRAEEELRKSETQLREMVENADEIIFTLSPDGIFTFMSSAWTRMLGHEVNEIIGHHFSEFVHPDYIEPCAAAVTDILNTGETKRDIEYLVRHKNGEWRWHMSVGTPIRDKLGIPVYIIGIAQDITERKINEASLIAATEELEHFFSSTIDLLCIADTQGYFRRVNREWEKILGYRVEELEGKRFLDFIHPDDIQSTLDAVSELQAQHEVINFINRYRKKDGLYRWIEWRSIPVGDKIYAAARDITERILSENALRENEERYRNFVVNASEGIYRIDFSKSILIDQPYEVLVDQIAQFAYIAEVNAALSAMYGLKPEQMIGRAVRDFTPNCGEQIADLIKTGNFRIEEREECEFDANGNPIYIVESYTGVVENGFLERVWGVQRNISERKRAEILIALQHDLAVSLSTVSGLKEGLQLCLDTAIKSSGMDSGGIYLYDQAADELNLILHQGITPEFAIAISKYNADTPHMQMIMAGKPVYSRYPLPGFPFGDPHKLESLNGIAILPINHQNRVIGCMNIASHVYQDVPKYSRDILETITAQIGNVISRLQSEEALRESEHRFRSIFDHAQDGILVADNASKKLLFGNQTITQMLGYSLDELKKLYVSDIHPKSALPLVDDHFSHTVGGINPTIYEIPTLRKDGSVFIAEIVAFEISLQGKSCMAGTFRDITDRKQAEEALRTNEEMLRSILQATPAGVGLLKDRVFIKSNRALSMITGYSEAEMLGKSTRLLYPNDEEYNRIGEELYPTMKETGLGIGEARLQHKNGSPIDVILYLSPFDPEDLSKGVTATILDITERKQVENALRENEAVISSILSGAPVGILLLKDRIIHKVNKTFSRIVGYTAEELLGKSTRVFYPDDDEFNRAGYEIYGKIETDGIGTGEALFQHKNGTPIDVFLYLSPLDPSDISKGITAIILDYTERKKAERILRENEALISSLFASVPVGLALIKNRVILKVNETLCKMFGYEEAELLGSTSQRLYVNEEEYIRTGDDIYGQIEQYGIGIGEARLQHKNGTTIDALLCLSPLDTSDISRGITVTLLDITDRKQAEAALRESEKKYRSVIENIQDVFYRADLYGRLLMGSPSGAKMFGYDSIDEMIGMSLSTLWVDPADRDKLIDQVKATGSVRDIEGQLRRKDGSTFTASFTTHFFFDENGNRLGTEGIIRDISEQKKAREEIHQLNEDLENRVKERTSQLETAISELEAFSYSVSHDLRAPLRAINGYASILMEDYATTLDQEGNRLCTVINKETRRMSHLIDDLLSFSRIGRAELQPYPVDMQALVNSVISDLVTPAEQKRFDFQVSPLEPGIGDSNLLRQVWMNLISNAIKFTSQKECAIIHITSEATPNEVIYSICDNGAGFDMRYAHSLFGVFNRLHSDKEFEGTGVGLAIVHRIVTRHGGRAWGEGEVGKGATFYFSLPKREAVS